MNEKKIRQAAVLVLEMGEKFASEILKNFSQKDARKMIAEIDTIETVSEEELILALNDFISENERTEKVDIKTKEDIKSHLMHSVGSGHHGFLPGHSNNREKWIDMVRHQPPSMIVGILRDEHPQVKAAIIMVIFNNISSDSGVRILRQFSADDQKNILERIAKMGIISRLAIDSISEMLRAELKEVDNTNLVTVDGADTMANIIPYLDYDMESSVVGKLGDEDRELGDMIEDKIFPFSKLIELDKKSLQLLLSQVANDDLLLALKGSEKNVRDVFFKNMSSKSADILKDEMESKGPVKLSSVTAAQKKIIQIAKTLAKEEKIFLSKSDKNIVF